MSDHPAAHKLSELTSLSTQAAVASVIHREGRIEAIFTAALGCIGSLQVVAALIGWPGDKPPSEGDTPQEFAKLINSDSLLLAALLVNAMCPDGSSDAKYDKVGDQAAVGIGFKIDFGPSVLFEAMQNFEKFTGRPVSRQKVSPYLIDQTLKIVADSDNPLKQFLAQHRSTPGNLH